MAKRAEAGKQPKPPAFSGWISTDDQEIERRRWRGRTEIDTVAALEPELGHFGDFEVASASGSTYFVEIRDLGHLRNSCTCADFDTAGLGTCKHVEGVLHKLQKRGKRSYRKAMNTGSQRIEVFLQDGPSGELELAVPAGISSRGLAEEAERLAAALRDQPDRQAFIRLKELAGQHPHLVRVSRLLEGWMTRRLNDRGKEKRRASLLADVDAGRIDLDLLKYPLFPYQFKGMLHLALGERTMLADEMGLGKTVQALAAAELLNRVGGVERVLVVCPASLKTEWAEQISGATNRETQLVFGKISRRKRQYASPEFYTIVNFEQVRSDWQEIGKIHRPDLVILDEAQRIKNWRTQTADSVKRLRSRYAFVLTGTPLENRIDEVYSIVQYLDPGLLGPLFRFNRRYYVLDDRGRPISLQNLDELHERVGKVMLRRRKAEIEHDLPDRTVKNFFLPMSEVQLVRYEEYGGIVARLARIARKRALTEPEFKRMQTSLACMRMLCDTAYILDNEERDCPKLDELERVLEDILSEPSRKVIVFSEWVRMLSLVRERLDERDVEYAWHTGSVRQDQRRREIVRFKEDPDCRVFLSSESGSVGLNLQVASAVINLDLPWNPARLEQRIARAWRKHQKNSVSVINLVAENTIEHRMLNVLEAKQGLSDAVLDGASEDGKLDMPSGRAAFLGRLESVLQPAMLSAPDQAEADPVEESLSMLKDLHGTRLYAVELRKDKPDGRSMLVVLQDLNGSADSSPDCPLPAKMVDRQSYETMLRMEEQGLIDFSGDRIDMLYRFTPEDEAEAAARRNRKRAAALLADADRRRQMAALLAGGGFEPEAARQAGPIASLAVRAMASLDGIDDGDTAIPELCEILTDSGVMTESLSNLAYRICLEDADPSDNKTQAPESPGGGFKPDMRHSSLAESEQILAHATELIRA